ncbi:putative terminal deoxynucleotidyl transferase [Aspergillus uvarum CBS 121591]|uniref:Putative terminal deoxynucleotidyl transferase n=1 Tax=Aspergillus uvarum CBS 121591 TaxID=1448315 RepID=A0A319CJE7_9EURO|nr:putative terminal deoxynucleotidyl transferase [Aspergillus uvarum CBS 121591]PYH85344.1 putative terminal deoxynucleotidyl transferase [Aspergillus uvarum CBS 121591]
MSETDSGAEHDDPDPSTPDFSACPPIFVLQTHLTIESLHAIEEELVRRNARLTYDIDEPALILGKLSQAKRAALELRTLGVWTEPARKSDEPPPAKRRRGNGNALSKEAEVIDLNTETEDEEDGMSSHASSTHLRPANPTTETPTLTVVKLDWLHACLRTNTILPTDEYTVYHARRIERPPAPSPPTQTLKAQTQTSILARAKADASMQPPAPQPTRPYQSYHQRHHQKAHPRTQPTQSTHPPKLHRTTTSEAEDLGNLPPPPAWVTAPHNAYACLRSTPLHPPNEPFINELLTIRHIRELTLDEIGVRAYSTAIASIAAYPYPLRRPAEVAGLPGCDAKIANLFYEFQQQQSSASSSILTATHPLTTDPTLRTLHTFYNIWGVGAKTAREFYFTRGWRSLDDIIEYGWASLSRVQQIGVKFYDEFQEGIPRAEVEGIAAVVRRHADAVIASRRNPHDQGFRAKGVECIITGSHRRGKPFSGDVDLILSHRDEDATKDLIGDVLRRLEGEGWITHTLALHQGHSAREQATLPFRNDSAVHRKMFDSLDKGLVVWQLPLGYSYGGKGDELAKGEGEGSPRPHRRVDIIISPWRTVGCAVLGWSGDKTFERDLRRFVKQERGWKFDSSGVRERRSGGLVVDLEGAGETWEERERLVMEGLGIGFRGPGERCTR